MEVVEENFDQWFVARPRDRPAAFSSLSTEQVVSVVFLKITNKDKRPDTIKTG